MVARPEPFQRTRDVETNPEPDTMSEKAGPPAATLDGDKEPAVGVGLVDAGLVAVVEEQPKSRE